MGLIKITQDNVRDIKGRVDLVDIASEWMDLKKNGENYKGCCPFHKEKTPSFVINQEKQIYHCFGCGVGGDLISFVQNIEGLTFYDAVIKLAALANIELKQEHSEYNKGFIDKKQKLKEINIFASNFFIKNITGSATNNGIVYAQQRALALNTIDVFKIGYAPNAWDELTTLLIKKSYSLADAVSIGLLKEKNGKYYDVYRDRLMFPIFDHRGEIIAFGGRKILEKKEDESPKYINSKESELYKKGEILYGLYQTNRSIREAGYAVVVEGYMDLVSLYQHGIQNVVATLGTAFTEKQAKLIKRYTDRVVMFYDGDYAGINAAKKSLTMLLKNNINVDFCILDGGMDPDDAVKKLSKDELENEIKNAKPLLARIITDLFSGDFNIAKISDNTSRVLEYLALIPDALTKALWIKEISMRSGLDIGELNKMLRNLEKKIKEANTVKTENKVFVTNMKAKKVPNLYKHLIRILIKKVEYCTCIFDEEWDMYIPNDLRNLLMIIKNRYDDKKIFSEYDWMDITRENDLKWLESELSKVALKRIEEDGPDLEKDFKGCMLWFKENYLKSKRMECYNKIKEGEKSEKTLREYEAIVQEINQLKR